MKKLKEFDIGIGNRQEITKEIFVLRIGDTVVKGLVESNSQGKFAEELIQKSGAHGNSEAQFSECFKLHKLQHICNCMTSELRATVGIGFPPKP